MIFKIALPYVVRKQVRDQRVPDGSGIPGATTEGYWKHDRQITEQLVRAAINAKYPQGSKDESIQELNADIDEAFTGAINAGRNEVDLARGAVKHVLTCIEAWDSPAEWHAHVRRLRIALKDLITQHDAEEKAKKNGVETATPEPVKA